MRDNRAIFCVLYATWEGSNRTGNFQSWCPASVRSSVPPHLHPRHPSFDHPPSQLIKALALRVMTSIRVPDIIQIQLVSNKQ